jgi:transcriptional regulator with XRE-family HTH domain
VCRVLGGIRRQKRMSQSRLGLRIGISRSEVSRWERSALRDCSVEDVERWAAALGAPPDHRAAVYGERPQSDAEHARLQGSLIRLLGGAGWIAEPEVSFNVYGHRGRIDLLGYHPSHRVLLVEVKTRLIDVQDVIGRRDIKRRVAPSLAAERGWSVVTTVPALVIRESTTARLWLSANA